MHNGSKQPSQRQLKVGEEIRHLLSSAFMRGDFYNPKTRQPISITVSEVRVSPDFKNATVYFVPFSGNDEESTIKILETIAPYVGKTISNKIRLRRFPVLKFKIDKSFEEASKIEAVFQRPEVIRDLESK